MRSLTVVEDLAQYSGPYVPGNWGEVPTALETVSVEGVGEAEGRFQLQSRYRAHSCSRQGRQSGHSRGDSTPLREEALNVCYHMSATIVEVAEGMVTQLDHSPVCPIRSVHDLPDCLEVTDLSQPPEGAQLEVRANLPRGVVAQELACLDEQVGAGVGRIVAIYPPPGCIEALLRQGPGLVAAMETPRGDVLCS